MDRRGPRRGVQPLPPAEGPRAGPARWSVYVNVDDADDAVARSDAAGGSTVMAPLDVTDAGLWAVVAAPLGASIGIGQPGEHLGAQIVNEPVSYVWSSLHTDRKSTRLNSSHL